MGATDAASARTGQNGGVSQPPQSLSTAARPSRLDRPDGLLVLLHGRGTSEQDLAPLFDLLDPEGRLACASPRAPFQFPGMPGNHWYVVERVGFPDRDTFAASYAQLGEWLAEAEEWAGSGVERTVIGGFSQGTVMSYALGLGSDRPRPAGILALSGFVPEVEGWEPDLASRAGMPVLISHGAADPVIGVEFARAARDLLEPAGLDLTYREAPLGHSIDGPTIDAATEWLEAALPRLPL
jgi:phospholipase/carboxylesterase